MQSWMIRIGLFVLALSVAGVRIVLAQMSIDAPVTEFGTSVWEVWIPMALALTCALGAIVALIMHHTGVFVALLLMIVVIFFVGQIIPAAITGSGLSWGF